MTEILILGFVILLYLFWCMYSYCRYSRKKISPSSGVEFYSIENVGVTIHYLKRDRLYLYGDEVLHSRLKSLCRDLYNAKRKGTSRYWMEGVIKCSSLVVNLENEFIDSVSDVYPGSSMDKHEVVSVGDDTYYLYSGDVFYIEFKV